MGNQISSNKKRVGMLLAAIAIVLFLAFYLFHWATVGRYTETTDDAYVGGNVTVISPKVAGNIVDVAVTDNQFVHAGDLLVRLDPRDYRVALEKAEAAVAAQQAALTNLEATRHLQDSLIDQARAGIAAASAETGRTRDDQTRYQKLSETNAVSIQSYQKADADYKQAVANGQKAQAALVASQRQLEVLAAQKEQLAAALAQAQAERDMAKLNLSYTELRAPVDGVIGNRRARLGAYAVAGQQLLSVVPAQGLWVDANFKESQLAHVSPGMPVKVTADVLPGTEFDAHVLSLAPATGAQFSVLPAENATGNFTKIVQRVPVRIQLDGAAGTLGKLRPGLSVTVEVDGRPHKQIVVSEAAARSNT